MLAGNNSEGNDRVEGRGSLMWASLRHLSSLSKGDQPGGGVAQHGGDLAQLHEEGALRDGQGFLRRDVRKDAVGEAYRCVYRRHKGPAYSCIGCQSESHACDGPVTGCSGLYVGLPPPLYIKGSRGVCKSKRLSGSAPDVRQEDDEGHLLSIARLSCSRAGAIISVGSTSLRKMRLQECGVSGASWPPVCGCG